MKIFFQPSYAARFDFRTALYFQQAECASLYWILIYAC